VEIAYGSVMEIMSQAMLSQRRQYLSLADVEQLRALAVEMSRMLSGLRASLK
jgi:four helix bundle protein